MVLSYLEPSRSTVTFESQSGPLTVSREGDLLVMDFPSREARPCTTVPRGLVEGLGVTPEQVLLAERDCLAVFATEAEVRRLRPRPGRLAAAGADGHHRHGARLAV